MSLWTPRAAMAMIAVILAAAAGASARPAGPQLIPSGEGLPDGVGKDVTVKACGTCHEARRAASVRLTRDGWAAVIEGMRNRGARVSDEEFPVILAYLSTHFLGEASQPLNVNTASQIDFEAAGGLLRREAAAVVQVPRETRPLQDARRPEEGSGARFQEDR